MVPEIAPLVAVIVPLPRTRPAVNIADAPGPGSIVPSAAGDTRHVRVAGEAFPNASVVTAVNRRELRARTWLASGAIEMLAAGPAVTVTCCVPAVTPEADAVSVCVPARVPRK